MFATVMPTKEMGESYNLGTMGYITVTANLHKKDPWTGIQRRKSSNASLGELPKGINIEVAGLAPVLDETLEALLQGLLIAVVVIFLMLFCHIPILQGFVGNFINCSFCNRGCVGCPEPDRFYAEPSIPIWEWSCRSGVSIANAVLLISNAETIRKSSNDALGAAKESQITYPSDCHDHIGNGSRYVTDGHRIWRRRRSGISVGRCRIDWWFDFLYFRYWSFSHLYSGWVQKKHPSYPIRCIQKMRKVFTL